MSRTAVSTLGIEHEAERILNYLASVSPNLAMATTTKPIASRVLLKTDGVLSLRGSQWWIKCKSIGAGVCRLTLELREVKP